MATIANFSPCAANSTRKYTITTSALSATAYPSYSPVNIESLLLFSPTTNTYPIFIAFGDSSVVAAVPTNTVNGGIELAPGAYLLVNDVYGGYFSAITTGGNATLNITYGVGQ